MDKELETILKEIKADLEILKEMAVEGKPFAKTIFCKHIPEKRFYKDLPIGGEMMGEKFYYQCSKCGLMLNEDGTPEVHNLF